MTISSFKHLQDHPREFFRLKGLPLPVPDNHEHYLEMWMKYDESIRKVVNQYNLYLDWCKSNGFSSPQSYRADHAGPKFLAWAKESCTLDSLVFMEEAKHKFVQKDKRASVKGELLLSIDMVKANFTAMKLVALQRDIQIPETWEDLCRKLDIHPFLADSKMFRQHCFGVYEPSKCAAIQKHIIANLVHGLNVDDDDVIYVSHDEIVIRYPEGGTGQIIEHINDITGFRSCVSFKLTMFMNAPVYDVVIKKTKNLELEKELEWANTIKNKFVEKQRYEDAAEFRNKEREIAAALHEHYSKQLGEQCKGQGANGAYSLRTEYHMFEGELKEDKKSLVGVPSNKFYSYFRTMLLNEPYQDKDLLFIQDGMLAKWVLSEQIE